MLKLKFQRQFIIVYLSFAFFFILATATANSKSGGEAADESIWNHPSFIQIYHMTQFNRLLNETDTTYLVYYYVKSSENSRKVVQILQSIQNKLDYLASVAMVDCDTIEPKEDTLGCKEDKSSQDSFPRIELYEPPVYKFNPYTNKMNTHIRKPYAQNEVSETLLYNFITQNIPSRALKLTNENFEKFASNIDMNKVILFTDKDKTPLMFRGISNYFYNQILFGEVTKDQSSLIKKFKITTYPTLIIYQTHEEEVPLDEPKIEQFTGKITAKDIVKFIQPYALKEKLYLRSNKPSGKSEKMTVFKKLTRENVMGYIERFKEKRFVIYMNKNKTEIDLDIQRFNIDAHGFFLFIHLDCSQEEEFCKSKFNVRSLPGLVMINNKIYSENPSAPIEERLEKEMKELSLDYGSIVRELTREFSSEVKDANPQTFSSLASEAQINHKVPFIYFFTEGDIPLCVSLISSEPKYTKFVDFLAYENPPADLIKNLKIKTFPQMLIMIHETDKLGSAKLISYNLDELVYSRLRSFIEQSLTTEQASNIKEEVDTIKRDVEYINTNDMLKKHCVNNKKLCLIAFLDGRKSETAVKVFDESMQVLKDVNDVSQKRPISFGWVNATCQNELIANFNIDVISLPNLVVYAPSKDVYAKFIGTFDKENIELFIDKIIQGKTSFIPITKDKVNLIRRNCEELKEVIETTEDDELLKEIIEEEKRKREEFDRERQEPQEEKKKKKKKKKKSDL